MKVLQTTLTLDYGINREQSYILCHLASECGGCCAKCNHNNGCHGQSCSQPGRDHDGQRWDTWMSLVSKYPHIQQYARKVIPANLRKKYGINKLMRNH